MLNMTKRFRLLRSDEHGSIIIAVGVAMVMSFLLAATLSAVYSTLTQTRTDQNRTNAFQFANAGVDDATYRLDHQDLPTAPVANYVPVVSGGNVTSFTETLTVNGSLYSVNVVQDPAGQSTRWTSRSTGTDKSGRKRLAISTISATPIFVNGFFTLLNFYLSGNQTTPIAYRSSTCPDPTTQSGPDCDLPKPIPARLGTNGTFTGANETVDSFVADWNGFNMYGRATQAAADQACASGRCSTSPEARPGVVAAITDQYMPFVPGAPGSPDTLPSPLTCANLTGTVPPGNYVCTNLTLKGTVTVGTGGNGSGIVRFWVTGALTFASNSKVNHGQRPQKMQFFQCAPASAGVSQSLPCPGPGGGSICDAEIWALLDTPGLPIDCTGQHQPKIYGSVIAQVHGGTGNHFDFHWDADSQSAVNDGKFVVTNWRECPPGSTDC
jgi:hypothetical protein